MSPLPRLYYFDLTGKAEAIRLAFSIGGIPFEDIRIEYKKWPEYKRKSPTGMAPWLEIGDRILVETLAIMTYAGTLSGLIPSSPLERGSVFEVMLLADGIFAALSAALRRSREENRPDLMTKHLEQTFPEQIARLDARVAAKARESGLLGEALTIADLILATYLDFWLRDEAIYAIKFDIEPHQALKKLYRAVYDHPDVKAHYAQA